MGHFGNDQYMSNTNKDSMIFFTFCGTETMLGNSEDSNT